MIPLTVDPLGFRDHAPLATSVGGAGRARVGLSQSHGLTRLLRPLAIFIGTLSSVQAGSLFVASQGAGELARIEPSTNTLLGRIPVGKGPAGIAADRRGRVYLTHPDDGAITVLDADSGRVLRRLPYEGQPFGIAASPDGRFILVGDWTGNRVSRIAPETGAVEGVVEVGRDPANLVIDRQGRVFVTDRENHQISVIDAASMARVAVIPVGTAPFALALSPNEDRVYVANVRSNDLSVLDTATLTTVATIPVGAMPYGVATSPDGARILVTNQHSGRVTVLDADSLAILKTIKVGDYPEGVVMVQGRAYVANWFSDDISVIDLASLTETGRIGVGEGPRNLCLVSGSTAEAAR